MDDRPLLETRALDDPRAEVSRDVDVYLSRLGREHAVFIDQISSAAIVLEGRSSALAAAVAQQGRLTAQFLDAQRAILRLWADVDAKAARLVETANLELALMDADPLPAAIVRVDELDDSPLRHVLDGWWADARRAGSAAIEQARTSVARHVHLARLEPGTVTGEHVGLGPDSIGGGETVARTTTDSTAAAVLAALEAAEVADLPGMLDALLGRLTEPAPSETSPPAEQPAPPVAASPVDRRADLTFVDPPAEDAFERFWGGHLLPAGRLGRLMWRTLLPLGATVAGLTVLLAWIG